MLELKIYGEDDMDEKQELSLRLVRCGNRIELTAVDSEGESVIAGILLAVTSDGTVVLYSSLNSGIGLNITEAGYVKVSRG